MKLNDTADAQKAAELLQSLVGKISEIKSMEVGVDRLGAAFSYDLALTTTHEDAESLRAYQAHPAHQEVISWLGPRLAGRAIVDY